MNFVFAVTLLFGTASIQISSAVFNGQPGTQANFPYMASIKDTNGSFVCSGVILNQRWILTAAHCNEPSLNWVGVGSVELSQQTNYVIDMTFPFPGYLAESRMGDIMLIKTVKFIQMQAGAIGIILLNKSTFNDPATPVRTTVVGWGFNKSPSPNSLMHASYDTLLQNLCWKMSNVGDLHYAFSGEVSICAVGSLSTPTSIDTACAGDSGSPLIYNNLVHGLASRFMTSCCPSDVTLPDVFTRVSNYYPWIDSIVHGNTGGTV